MAIAIENTTTITLTGSQSSNSTSFDCTGADKLVVLSFMQYGQTATLNAPTYNGVSLTEGLSVVQSTYFNGTIKAWYLDSPATGSNTLQQTTSSTAHAGVYVQAYALSGAATGTFEDTDTDSVVAGGSNTTTTTVTTAGEAFLASIVWSERTLTIGGSSDLTQRTSFATVIKSADSIEASGGTYSSIWTNSATPYYFLHGLVAVAAGGGGGGYRFVPQLKPFGGL